MNNDQNEMMRSLLDEVLLKGIERNEEQRKIWAAYKTGHQKVVEALQTLPQELYVNCMVPLGKRALMKGKLIHTNEVFANLGDGYFAKYSASGAAALCQRRIERAEEMLNNLTTERDLFETRMMVSDSDAFGEPGGEIVEHWKEEQIDEWKKRHREREKLYHQKLAKLRQEKHKKVETEEDLFQRLDQLEIEEELADEFNRLEDEKYRFYGNEQTENECYESDSTSDSEDDSKIEEESSNNSEKKQPDNDAGKCKSKKAVTFFEPETRTSKEEEEIMEKATNIETTEDGNDSNDEILRIEFTHTQNINVVKPERETIETPGDIYRIHSKPKSILKRSPNDISPIQMTLHDVQEDCEEEEEEEEAVQSSAYGIVVKDIKERDVTSLTVDLSATGNESRPVSKFKRDRGIKK